MTSSQSNSSSIIRFIVFAVGLIILLLFLLIISTPSVLSSRWGQNQLIAFIDSKIPGSLEVNELKVNWFGTQEMSGIVLKDPAGNIVASLDSLTTDSPLFDLVRGDFINSQLKINGLNATIIQNKSGSNFHDALGLRNDDSNESATPMEIQIKDVNAEVSMSGKHDPILINVKGVTSYGNNQGSFEANAVAAGLTSDKIERLNMTINNLPLTLIDELIAIQNPKKRGLVTAALGDTLNLTLVQSKADKGMEVTLDVTSPQLKAKLEGQIVGDQFTLSKPGQVSFALQPQFLADIAGYETDTVHPLEMTVEKLAFPLSTESISKLDTSLKGTLDRIPFDFDLSVDGSKVVLDLKGDRLNGHLALQVDDEITLSAPGYIQTNITPERYQALRRYINGKQLYSQLDLLKPTSARIDLKEFKLPASGPSNVSFVAEVLIDQLDLDDTKTNQEISFDKVFVNVNTAQLSKRIDFTVRNPEINLKGYVQNYRDEAHRIIAAQGSFKNLPAGALCELACFETKTRMKMESLLGPRIDGTINLQLVQKNGPVRLAISGSNGRFDLDGTMTNGVLTLNKPFTAEVKPTHELGESFLEDYIPILSGLVGGTEMIKLYVSNEGFSMPIDQFNIAHLQVNGLSLDLGRVQFTNDGELGKIMSALKARSSEYIDVWFTPIYISASQGVININRFDLLAMQRYQIAAWGTVNVPYDMIDMTIGLSGSSLSSALGIKIPDKNYMMQFPLKGSIGHASVDKTKVMAKLAALGTSIAGGPQGMVVGAVIGLATGTLKEPAAPSPTTQPFPWAGQQMDSSTTQNDEEKQPRQQNPVKGIKKEAGKLLKNIFK